MAPKKPAVTAKVLQALLTRIGSASSGTKSTLLARFQREIQQPGVFHHSSEGNSQPHKPWNRKLRVMSIDMGIKNLAFCDAEVSYSATESASESNLGATMNVLRWKKLDLVGSAYGNKDHGSAEDDADPYSPSVLSKTAHRLITEEVLSASPDIILIEKQRWRSGGGSAVQQWTVRVNTLEAMLWAILETLKATPQIKASNGVAKRDYSVYAIDPKRVGQYWLSRHARAQQERNNRGVATATCALLPKKTEDQDPTTSSSSSSKKKKKNQPTRTKAEKSAKIHILRAWLSTPNMSTSPSTPALTPHIAFSLARAAQPTRGALLPPQPTAPRRRKKADAPGRAAPEEEGEKVAVLADVLVEMKKLDDVTDCFLQAAAWVAWELDRVQMRAVSGGDGNSFASSGDERWILNVVDAVREA